MSNKIFSDLSELQRRNRYNKMLYERSKRTLRDKSLIEEQKQQEEVESQKDMKSEVKKLIDKLNVASENVFIIPNYLGAAVDKSVPYLLDLFTKASHSLNKVIEIMKPMTEEDIFNLTREDIKKILSKFKILADRISKLEDLYIEYLPNKTANLRFNIANDPQGNKRLTLEIAATNLYNKMENITNFAEILDNRSGTIGSGFKNIPRKYM